MKNIFYKVTARTMLLNRTRTIVTILGVGLSAAMLTAVAVFGVSILKYLETKAVKNEGSWHVAVEGLQESEIAQLGQDERVKSISLQEEVGYIKGSENDGDYIRIVNRDENAWKNLPLQLEKGRIPENDREILIPYEGMELDGQEIGVGDKVTLEPGLFFEDGRHIVAAQMSIPSNDEEGETRGDESEGPIFRQTETITYDVVGIYRDMAQSRGASGFYGYVLIAGPPEKVNEQSYCDAYIEMKKPKDADGFISDYLEGKEYESYVSWSRHDSLLRWQGVFRNERYTYLIGGTLGTLLAVIVIGSVLLIYNSFSISLRERTAQFGILSSVGATKRQLRQSLRFEAFMVSLAGIPLGLAAGAAGSAVTLHFIGTGITSFMYGENDTIKMVCPLTVLAGSALLSFLTVLLSVWIPAARAGKVSPMEAVRSLKDIRIHPREVKTTKLAGSLFGLEGMLAGKNYRRDRKKYRSTIISLTMSIVLFVTASLFLIYMEEAGTIILDPPLYELEYETYLKLNREDENGQNENVVAMTKSMLDQEELVDSYEFYKQFSILIPIDKNELSEAYLSENYWSEMDNGSLPIPCKTIVLQDEDYKNYLEEQELEEPKNQDGIIHAIYYNQMKSFSEESGSFRKTSILSDEAVHQQRSAGRFVSLQSQEESTVEDRREYEHLFYIEFSQEASELPKQYGSGNVSSPVLIFSEKQAQQYVQYAELPAKEGRTAEEALYVGCFEIHAKNYKKAAQNLTEEIQNLPEEMRGILYTPAEEAAMNRQAVLAIRVLCYGFIILLSLIAVANVFNTISTNLMLRRREIAMLRSVGMTKQGFRKMMIYECLVYGIRSVIYGWIFSIAVSFMFWKFTSQASGQKFIFPWVYFAVAAAGVVIVVFMTMIYTMRKMKKFNIIDELRMVL